MFKTFYPQLNTNIDYAWFLIFYYRLIWTYKDDQFINEKVDIKAINKFQSIVSVYTQEIISKYYILYSKYLLLKNKSSEIKNILQNVNLSIFYVGDHRWLRSLYEELMNSTTNVINTTSKPSKLKASPPLSLNQRQKVV